MEAANGRRNREWIYFNPKHIICVCIESNLINVHDTYPPKLSPALLHLPRTCVCLGLGIAPYIIWTWIYNLENFSNYIAIKRQFQSTQTCTHISQILIIIMKIIIIMNLP